MNDILQNNGVYYCGESGLPLILVAYGWVNRVNPYFEYTYCVKFLTIKFYTSRVNSIFRTVVCFSHSQVSTSLNKSAVAAVAAVIATPRRQRRQRRSRINTSRTSHSHFLVVQHMVDLRFAFSSQSQLQGQLSAQCSLSACAVFTLCALGDGQRRLSSLFTAHISHHTFRFTHFTFSFQYQYLVSGQSSARSGRQSAVRHKLSFRRSRRIATGNRHRQHR